MDGRVLVSLHAGDVEVGIVRSGEEMLFSCPLGRDPGVAISTHLSGGTARTGISGVGVAIGGMLPPGATRAYVTAPGGERTLATTGGGAWIALVPGATASADPPVRFEDDGGRIVRPPLPASWAREPVPDAHAACPACDATDWELVTPTDDSRGSHQMPDGEWAPAPVLACVRCGHEEHAGVWYAADDDEEEESDLPAAARPEPPHAEPDLSALAFPVYEAEGAAPGLTGWSAGEDGVYAVSVRGPGDVVVETEARAPLNPDHLRHALAGSLWGGDEWPAGLSPAGMSLHLAERRRAHDARAAAAQDFATEIAVDGTPTPFTGIRDGDAWAATGRAGEVTLTVTATTPPSAIRLRRRA